MAKNPVRSERIRLDFSGSALILRDLGSWHRIRYHFAGSRWSAKGSAISRADPVRPIPDPEIYTADPVWE